MQRNYGMMHIQQALLFQSTSKRNIHRKDEWLLNNTINDLFLEDNKKPKTHISASDTLYSSTTILGLSTFELLFVLTMSHAKVQKISHICTCENECNIHLEGLHCYCSKYREIYYSIFLHLLLLL